MELSRIKAAPSASVAGGAAYANRNPLFRPPADGDSTSTTQSGSDRGSASLTAARHPTNHTNHANRNGRGHDDRHGRLRPAVGFRGTASGSTRSDASGARLIQSRLSDGGGDGGGGSGGGIGGGGIDKGNREDIAIPDRSRHLTDEDGGDSIWSDMSGMEGLQHPKREGRHRRGGDGVGSGGHARTSSISSGVGMGHARTGSSSSGVGTGGGVSSGGMKGQEPAVKTCGCMTTATFLKLVTLVVALCNVAALWIQHYDASSGKLCSFSDKNACVTSVASKVLLSIARLSAGALFPSIACCVLSKCYATRYFLHHSWLTLIVDLEPTHKLHTYFGVLTLLCSLIHTVAHIARAFYETHPDRLYGDAMNLSGLAATFLLLPVAMPMMMGYMKKKLTYELRKLMHMLFIPFIVAICFHGSVLRTLGIVLLVWYLLDRLYFTTKMTFFIDRPIFKAVGRGTLVRFELPTGYQYKPGAYVQVNCPAISASEWHPFSIFPVPGPTARAGFHVEAVGDWTEQLFRHGLEDPRMPLWITAAQPSVLEQTLYYDNVLLVCSGAGITPAVSVAERFAKKKNVHLLWLSREAGMVAMFEKQLHRVKSTVYLTGKPSAKTKKRIIDLLAPSRAEVVAKTSTSHKPSSRASSCSDLTMLEDGALADTASFLDYRGTFRDDENKTERATDDGQDESVFGESMLGGSSRESPYRGRDGDRDSKARGHGRHRRRPSRGRSGRSRGLHPVSLNFGRPNIEEFIAETIQGTAVVAEWAGHEGPPPETESRAPPTNLRQVMSRLNTNQRMSKMDLMSADLSIVEAKPGKSSSVSGAAGFAAAGGGAGGKTVACPVVRGTWLVLYCGGNAKIEQAVASACNRLNVTWRREYFSAW